MNEERKIPQGWQCPVCGQVNAPWTVKCDGPHQRSEAASTSTAVYIKCPGCGRMLLKGEYHECVSSGEKQA